MLFLEKCITEIVFSSGLRFDLQPITIDNFLPAGNNKLQIFSKKFMKDIANFCKTPFSKLAHEIKETENELLEKETYEEIKETINANQNIRDRTVRQQKQKKFQQLKFKPRQPQKYDIVEKDQTPTEVCNSKSSNEKSYASAIKKAIAKQVNKEKEVIANLNER